MDGSGQCENGRHKAPPGQRMMHQLSMKQIMGIMAERDAAIQERNLAITEKKRALADRDMAILQRDTALAERNNAIMERDNAIATLQHLENALNNGNVSPCPDGCRIPRVVNHVHHPQQQQHVQHQSHMTDTLPASPTAPELANPRPARLAKEAKQASTTRKTSKPKKKAKLERDDLNNTMSGKPQELKKDPDIGGSSDDLNKQPGAPKPDWKDQDLRSSQVAFDESTMPLPVCSCTGTPRQCSKWGNGGWQSSCCTTYRSMYPLPAVPNKQHARVGGRKMNGIAFNKLLSRLAAEGHYLSIPVDLKEQWAKHGTHRYITIKLKHGSKMFQLPSYCI